MSQSQDTPMVEDPAASLRAAALLTLKSKRRKPLSASDAPRPVAVPPSIQLDYGQEEPSGASSIASSPAAPPASIDVDDGQTREEGEISDSELPPARVCKPPRVSPVKIEPTPVMIPPVMTVSTIVAPAVDPSHVRPGLALTQAQYDTAKDIVLDLLGWGVPPEYLISCGLSREVVYYVFVELNLRLPANLDISGIPPYGPPPSSDSTIRSPQVHPSLPQKPSDPQGESVTSPVGASAGVPPVSPSLLDMEQQRRQELLARKAVLASRKLKQQGSLESTASVPTVTTAAAVTANIDTVVPTKTVEDFLKTIEPEAASSQSSSRADVSDAMDVDEPIPGLTASDNSMRFSSQPPASSTRSMSISDTVSPTSAVASSFAASVITETPFHRSPVDLVPTNEPTSGKEEDDAMDVIPGLFGDRSGYSAPQPPSAPPRRGGKRPVAADFVDMEPGPSSRTHSSNGFHGSHFFRGSTRRKTGGFAGLSGMRRCVIDVSDSEGESEDRMCVDGDSRHFDHYPALVRMNSRVSQSGGLVSRVDSPGTIPSGAMSPAALLEKEEEIRRMRELINKKREQNKLRKLASMTQDSTPPAPVSDGGVTVKQEEDEAGASAALTRPHSHSTDIPDYPMNGVHSDGSEEHSVLAELLPDSQPLSQVSTSVPSSASTSSSTTPIDVISNAFEHTTTGDKVLTEEARQEQVVVGSLGPPSSTELLPSVDVLDPHVEASAQSPPEWTVGRYDQSQEPEEATAFISYESPLDWYPLLRTHSRQNFPGVGTPSSNLLYPLAAANSRATDASVDLRPLKIVALYKSLSDTSRRICQYEVPGGGECRDRNCESVHLSRFSAVEPSDEDTAEYLHASIPTGSQLSVKDFRDALEHVRRRSATKGFDDRVSEALASLGLR